MMQEDGQPRRDQDRKRSREDRAPSESGHARKRRTAEASPPPRASRGAAGADAMKRPRDDSRESSHERWVGGNASPVDVNDRWGA